MIKPSLITGAIVLAFAWRVGYDHYQQSQQTVRTVEKTLQDEQATQEVRGAVARSLGELEQFHQQLSPVADTEWLVSQVSQFARESGIRLSAIAQQEPRTLQGVTLLAVTLQLNAPYHQVSQFISALENAPMFLRVDDVTIGGSDQDHTRVRMTVSTFHLPMPLHHEAQAHEPNAKS